MIFDLLFKKEKIYCQNCGEEIDFGGYVGGKKVYCNKEGFPCLIQAFNSNTRLHFEYKVKRELLEDIKSKQLVYFSKLEKSVER